MDKKLADHYPKTLQPAATMLEVLMELC